MCNPFKESYLNFFIVSVKHIKERVCKKGERIAESACVIIICCTICDKHYLSNVIDDEIDE